jgi:2-keto-3-deoxy-L-rhamnonate aldolase RhmA/quercetin dioxygenase-like cupin family protein
MNILAIQRLRQKLANNETVYGLWITLESPVLAEMAVALGLDWIVIDTEHGHLDWKDVLHHLQAAARSQTVVLVRLAELNAALVKRALDIGADGVVIPWIETAAQLEQAVKSAHYPPEGQRGIGGERATAWGQCFAQHTAEANDHVLVVPLIESVAGGKNTSALCQVKGTELFFLGPADYSASAGHRGQWLGPGVEAELLAVKDAIRAAGKHCGIMATGLENIVERRQDGFRMIGLGSDCGLFLRALHGALGAAGRDRPLLPSLLPAAPILPATPLPRPPESRRPDRPEMMGEPGKNKMIDLAPGVHLDCLVSKHNHARRLTTGLVTFEPSAILPYHTHPVSESITVLSGELRVEVEGREYTLQPFDNIIVPRGLPHTPFNSSKTKPGVAHVALASEAPARDFISTAFEKRPMPDTSTGVPGKERVTRFAAANRFAAGPGTSFIDYFNQELMPGIEMSGGYGLFQPGGRLPAHFHDFDESITITDGRATCVVEGRRYQMAGCATALQPRGRVHYFINETSEPMAMIWVYAGPTPERVVVEEACAATEGNPWKDANGKPL